MKSQYRRIREKDSYLKYISNTSLSSAEKEILLKCDGRKTNTNEKKDCLKKKNTPVTNIQNNYSIQETDKRDNTPYDDVGKTLLHDCPALLIPVINEIFDENYSLTDKVEPLSEVHIFQSGTDELTKGYKDGYIRIIGKKTRCYHIELQSVTDSTMVFRMFEYDIGDALKNKVLEGNKLVITIVRSAVIFLRHDKSTPDVYVVEIHTPGGNVSYEVPVLKTQMYSLDEIFKKKLLFLLPFHLFCYSANFDSIENDVEKLSKLKEEYKRIKNELELLHQRGEINLYEKQTIISMINKVSRNLAWNHQKIQEGVDEFMGGKVLMHEAKAILMQGIEQEKKNTEKERKRADEALLEIARLKELLAQNGILTGY